MSSYNKGAISLIPSLILIILLIIAPAVYLVIISVYKESLTLSGYFLLFGDPDFLVAVKGSMIYTVCTVSLQMGLGIVSALLVYSLKRYRTAVLVMLFLPYAVPSAVAVISWKLALADKGFLSLYSERIFGIPTEYWMSEGAFISLIVVSVWQFYPFVLLTMLAGLYRIPRELVKSSILDGASCIQRYTYVVLPQLKGAIIAVAILRLAFMFTKFDTPFLFIGDASNTSINLIPFYIYENGAVAFPLNASLGACAGVFIAFMVAVVAGLLCITIYARSKAT